MTAGPQMCSEHQARRAGWTCSSCHKALCPGCATARRAGGDGSISCRHCGAIARTLLVPKPRGTYLSTVWGAFAYPFSSRGLLVLAGAGTVFSLLERLGFLAQVLVAGLVYSMMFLVVRTTALGHEDVPVSDEGEGPWEAVAALVKGLTALVLAFLPAVAYLWLVVDFAAFSSAEDAVAGLASDPLLYLSCLVGALWTPAALMLAATHSPFTSIINPLTAVRMVRAAGVDYLVATVFFWTLFVGRQLVDGLAGGFEEIVPIPIVARAFARSMMLYLPFVMARGLGLLLFVRGPQMGYGRVEDAMHPALGAQQPEPEVAAVAAPVDEQPVEEAMAVQELTLPPPEPAAAGVASPPAPASVAPAPAPALLSELPELPPVPSPALEANPWGDLESDWPEPSSAPTEVVDSSELQEALTKARKPPRAS